MKDHKRIDDIEVFKLIENIQNGIGEQQSKDAILVQLQLLVDIRMFLRKVYKSMPSAPKVYKRPTNNKNDIIVGK